MPKYLLPCECGESVPIDPSQAGQTTSCNCGRSLEVPTMRAVRQLEPYVVAQKPAKTPQWNAVAGAIFALGTIVAIGGFVSGGAFWLLWSQHNLPPTPQIYIDSYVFEVNDATAPETLDMWKETARMELAPYETSPEVEARRSARFYVVFIPYGFAVGAAGLLVAASALLFRRRR